MVELWGVMAMAAVSPFNWQFLSFQQRMMEIIHTTHWLQVVGVTRIQGYQAPVYRKNEFYR